MDQSDAEQILDVQPELKVVITLCGLHGDPRRHDDRQQHRQVCRRLSDAHPADDVQEHVLIAHRDAAVPVQHRQQHAPPRVDPGVPHRVHLGEAVHVGEPDRRRENARLVGAAALQQAGDHPGPQAETPRRRRASPRERRGQRCLLAQLDDLGRAKKVRVTKEDTTIVDGGGKKDLIQGRVRELRKQIEDTSSDYDREKLEERVAKLAGGVAVVKVGATTEVEMKEKKARVEDALHATRAAVEEGVVPGGGRFMDNNSGFMALRHLDNLDKKSIYYCLWDPSVSML